MFSSNTSAVSADAVFVEELFQTHLYTGNGSTQTITNGIDLAGKGGLVWIKKRTKVSPDIYSNVNHYLFDTARGNGVSLSTNLTNGNISGWSSSFGFNSNGFAITTSAHELNASASLYASWTFRKQPKFFDVVTYTGTSSATTIAHNLGSVPGCIIVKRTDSARDWAVYHRSLGATQGIYLNSDAAAFTSLTALWNGTTPTSTVFSVGGNADVNASGGTYVAYLFAHDAGGFGLSGTDNVISCGLTAANGSGNFSVTLGYEPQWVLMKSTGSGIWSIVDNMRGATASSGYTSSQRLQPQSSAAEDQLDNPYGIGFNATGFTGNLATFSNDFIYIAIRRGPMKTPTTGTSVFSPVTRTGNAGTNTITTPGFAPDALFSSRTRSSGGYYVFGTVDKLRGPAGLEMTATDAESAFSSGSDLTGWSNVGYGLGVNSGSNLNTNSITYIDWVMQRAPGFFDVVCYTGAGGSLTVNHNLGVVPELAIIKSRSTAGAWQAAVPSTTQGSFLIGTSGSPLSLNTTNGNGGEQAYSWSGAATATTFLPANIWWNGNASGVTYVAYLFASCPGVSKVGTYTGTGALQTVNCGFTGGARFVLIKRTDSTGDWFVYDSARGITSGNDPYVLLNSRNAEVTGTNYVDTTGVGFQVTAAAPAGINANGGTFVFLAVA